MMTIQNFGVVVPGKLYRGAQPNAAQFAELKALGVTDSIDLREPWGREAEAKACAGVGIAHHNVPIGFGPLSFGIEPPTNAEIAEIMGLIRAPGRVSFVHCAHGEDRTGAVIAAYRMLFDGRTNAQAFAEAEKFDISPFQVAIREWIERFGTKGGGA